MLRLPRQLKSRRGKNLEWWRRLYSRVQRFLTTWLCKDFDGCIKKNVSFLSRFLRICYQSLKKVQIRAKKNFFLSKIQYGYQKIQNFTLISNPLKKFWKNAHKKVISKNVTEICTFFVKLVLLIIFLVRFVTTFSTDSKSAWNSAFFDTFLIFFMSY